MVSEGSIPHDRLADVKAGQVLGALPSEGTTDPDVSVQSN